MLLYNQKLKARARELRREMTVAENLLWSRLRRGQLDGFRWYRQKPLANFIADFYCPKRKLIVELDGG